MRSNHAVTALFLAGLLAGCSGGGPAVPEPKVPEPPAVSVQSAAQPVTPPPTAAPPSPSQPVDVKLNWEWVSPHPQGNALRGVATSGKATVAVGDLGTVEYSPDRKHWDWLRSGDKDLYAVAFGNGRFVAVGDGGTILTATDPAKWQRIDAGVFCDLRAVIHPGGNGPFVAVGKAGCILTSADGLNWAPHPAPLKLDLYAVAAGGGKYVAAGDGDQLLLSTDGSTWAPRSVPKPYGVQQPMIRRLAYGNGRFMGIGPMALYASENGEQWTYIGEGTGTMDELAFGNGQFVALGRGQVRPRVQVWTAADGAAWQKSSRATDLVRPGYFAFAGSQWLGVGEGGAVLTSTDASHWERVTPDPGPTALRLAPGPSGGLVAAGLDGTLLTSADGLHWQAYGGVVSPEEWPRGVAYGNGKYLIVTLEGDGSVPIAHLSTDGAAWTKSALPFLGVFRGPVFDHGLFLLPASGGIWTSPDGQAWTQRALPGAQAARGVAALGGLLIAGDDNGAIFTSTDGISWVERYHDSASHENWDTFAAGNGIFLAMGSSEVLVSGDSGGTWTPHPLPEGFSTRGAAYGNGLFLAAGSDGKLIASADGALWTELPPVTRATLEDVSYIDGRFIVTGSYGTVLTARH